MKEKILLLHGALGTSDQMQMLSSHLENHFDVFTMEFTGHGNKAHEDATFDMQQLADEVIAYIESNVRQSVHVFGYSMGGYAALVGAKKRRDLFRSITTLGTKFDWTEATAQKEISFLNPELIMQKVPAFASNLEKLHGVAWKSLLKSTATAMEKLGRQPLLQGSDLRTCNFPITLIVGELDQTANATFTAQFAEEAGAGFHILAQTPHPIEKTDVALVAENILAKI